MTHAKYYRVILMNCSIPMLLVLTWHEDIVYPQVFIPHLAEEKERKPSVHDEQHPNTLFSTCTIWTFSAGWTCRPTGFIRKHRGLNNWKWNTNHVTRFLQQPFRHSLGLEVDEGTSRMTAISVCCPKVGFCRFYIFTDSNRWLSTYVQMIQHNMKYNELQWNNV